MAFEKICAICHSLIENTDQFIDLRQEKYDMRKLIEENSYVAHQLCFQKSFIHKGRYEQLKLFK